MQLEILAGGLGTRLWAAGPTYAQTDVCVGEPFLEYQLEFVLRVGELSMTEHFLRAYFSRLTQALDDIQSAEFEALVVELERALVTGASVFVFGNGGSGSSASHFACDLNKGVSYGKTPKFRAMCLNDNLPTLMAYANDISYEDVFVEPLRNFMKVDDTVIGISASGNSPNVLKAIQYAEEHGGRPFGICGYGGGKLKAISRQSLVVQSRDMQVVEDCHLAVFHCVMQCLCVRSATPSGF